MRSMAVRCLLVVQFSYQIAWKSGALLKSSYDGHRDTDIHNHTITHTHTHTHIYTYIYIYIYTYIHRQAARCSQRLTCCSLPKNETRLETDRITNSEKHYAFCSFLRSFQASIWQDTLKTDVSLPPPTFTITIRLATTVIFLYLTLPS
jgi:hypothetical protein